MGKAFLQDTFWFLWAKKLRARFQRGCLCVAFLVWVVWLVFYSVSPPRGASSRFQQPCLPWCPRGLRVSLLLPPYNQPHCTGIFHRFGFFLTHSPCYCQAESARGCWRDLVDGSGRSTCSTLFFPPFDTTHRLYAQERRRGGAELGCGLSVSGPAWGWRWHKAARAPAAFGFRVDGLCPVTGQQARYGWVSVDRAAGTDGVTWLRCFGIESLKIILCKAVTGWRVC